MIEARIKKRSFCCLTSLNKIFDFVWDVWDLSKALLLSRPQKQTVIDFFLIRVKTIWGY